jgi:hypothetical protein
MVGGERLEVPTFHGVNVAANAAPFSAFAAFQALTYEVGRGGHPPADREGRKGDRAGMAAGDPLAVGPAPFRAAR